MTSKENDVEYKFAGRVGRMISVLFDSTFFSLVGLVACFGYLGPGFTNLAVGEVTASEKAPFIIILLVTLLAFLLKDIIRGISPGAFILGIMVRKHDDIKKTPFFIGLLIRNILLMLGPIEFMAILISSERRRIGDLVASSAVYKNPFRANFVIRLMFPILFFGLFYSTLVGYIQVSFLNSNAYQTALKHIESNPKVLKQTGTIIRFGKSVSGRMTNETGSEYAEFNITVVGKHKTINVIAELVVKESEKWKVEKLTLKDEIPSTINDSIGTFMIPFLKKFYKL